jgi:16S rRNA (guanine527-N7)-methyltransferase
VRPPIRQALEALLSPLDASEGALAPLGVLLEMLAAPTAPTAVHDPHRIVDVHIADSLTGLEISEIRRAALIADLGSGAGLPGLVLAAVLPDAHLVLVESASRKCDFQRSAVAAMGLVNVEVVWARAEEWTDGIGRCDVVCARALASLPILYEYAAPLLRLQGVFVAWKAAVPAVEASDATAAATHLGLAPEAVHSVVPFAGSERRTLHVARKVAPTPPGFPRRPGIAAKRPLTAKTLR